MNPSSLGCDTQASDAVDVCAIIDEGIVTGHTRHPLPHAAAQRRGSVAMYGLQIPAKRWSTRLSTTCAAFEYARLEGAQGTEAFGDVDNGFHGESSFRVQKNALADGLHVQDETFLL